MGRVSEQSGGKSLTRWSLRTPGRIKNKSRKRTSVPPTPDVFHGSSFLPPRRENKIQTPTHDDTQESPKSSARFPGVSQCILPRWLAHRPRGCPRCPTSRPSPFSIPTKYHSPFEILHKRYFPRKAFLSWTPSKMNHFFHVCLQHV